MWRNRPDRRANLSQAAMLGPGVVRFMLEGDAATNSTAFLRVSDLFHDQDMRIPRLRTDPLSLRLPEIIGDVDAIGTHGITCSSAPGGSDRRPQTPTPGDC